MLSDLCVVERQLAATAEHPPIAHEGSIVLVLAGELEATLDGTKQTVGPGTLLSVPPGVPLALESARPRPARALTHRTPAAASQSRAEA
jgi:quercetin dioxygenase-like cupin family protein